MTSIVFSLQLKSTFSYCVDCLCKVSECELKLDGFPGERVILDVDRVMRSRDSGRRCDYVIVVDEGNDTFFLPIEFKSRQLNPERIQKQLEGSIKFFKKHLPARFRCYPVIVSKNLKNQERKRLLKIRVEYNGNKKKIKHVRCNQSLRWDKVKHRA